MKKTAKIALKNQLNCIKKRIQGIIDKEFIKRLFVEYLIDFKDKETKVIIRNNSIDLYTLSIKIYDKTTFYVIYIRKYSDFYTVALSKNNIVLYQDFPDPIYLGDCVLKAINLFLEDIE